MTDLNNTPNVVESIPVDAPEVPKNSHRSHTVQEWWVMRVSAVVLVPLSIWFMVSLFGNLIGADVAALTEWIYSPFVTLALTLMLSVGFIHMRLGLHEIIVDYVHAPAKKKAALLLVDLISLGLALASIVAVVQLHLAA